MTGVIRDLPDKRLLEPAMDEWTGKDLIAHIAWWQADRWPWLAGETLAETILWDTSRQYNAHREFLERLSR